MKKLFANNIKIFIIGIVIIILLILLIVANQKIMQESKDFNVIEGKKLDLDEKKVEPNQAREDRVKPKKIITFEEDIKDFPLSSKEPEVDQPVKADEPKKAKQSYGQNQDHLDIFDSLSIWKDKILKRIEVQKYWKSYLNFVKRYIPEPKDRILRRY